jgi:hypothetical protein
VFSTSEKPRERRSILGTRNVEPSSFNTFDEMRGHDPAKASDLVGEDCALARREVGLRELATKQLKFLKRSDDMGMKRVTPDNPRLRSEMKALPAAERSLK